MSEEGSGSAQGTEKEEEEKIEEDIALRKRPWTREEDAKLSQMVEFHGAKNWTLISSDIPGRSDKACRQRWFYKNPNSLTSRERREFTAEEDDIILRARLKHGNKWGTIAELLPGRSRSSVETRWRSIWWRKRPAEGSQKEQQDLSFVGTSASSSSNSEIDHFERGKRLCQREEEDVETPEMAWVTSLFESDPKTSVSPSLSGSGGDGGGSGGEEKKE